MKKSLFIAASAMLVLASCTNDESAPEQIEVGFNALTKKTSRAIELGTGNTFNDPSTAKFNVWGFYSQTATTENPVLFASETSPNFMNNVVISKVGDQWRNASAHYYWPMVGRVGFYALYPSSFVTPSNPTPAGTVSVKWNEGLKISGYSISDKNSHGDDAVDLMYGYVESDKTIDAVTLFFNHALSQLEFFFKQNAAYEGAEIKVNSITLKDVYLSGNFTYIKSENASWALSSKTDFIYNNPASSFVTTTTAAQFGKSTLFLPQDVSSKQAELSITITQNEQTTEAITYTFPINLKPNTVNSWVMGKRYVYTINFNLDEILFNPNVSTWTLVTVDQIDLD